MEKYTLITGATSGIGYELAKILAFKKYNLILVARNEEKLKEILNNFEKSFRIKVKVIATDLSPMAKPTSPEIYSFGTMIPVSLKN